MPDNRNSARGQLLRANDRPLHFERLITPPGTMFPTLLLSISKTVLYVKLLLRLGFQTFLFSTSASIYLS